MKMELKFEMKQILEWIILNNKRDVCLIHLLVDIEKTQASIKETQNYNKDLF